MEQHAGGECDLHRIQHKVDDIRKLLLGSLLLAKDIWRDTLEQESEILEAIEGAEETFIDRSLRDDTARIENAIDVIHTRAKGLFDLMEYMAHEKQKRA